jgi:hypothetical protein
MKLLTCLRKKCGKQEKECLAFTDWAENFRKPFILFDKKIFHLQEKS